MIKEVKLIRNKQYSNKLKIFYFEEKKVKLRGYIAFHHTKGVFSTGGTRLYNYKNKNDALTDVLRLAKAMNSKCCISGVPFSGGKAVIIGTADLKSINFLRSYAKIIDTFKGKFTTGTDVGISDEDTRRRNQTADLPAGRFLSARRIAISGAPPFVLGGASREPALGPGTRRQN